MLKKNNKSTNKLLNKMMILCLNKKAKIKEQKERECISSIQTFFYYNDEYNSLFISIDSKTSAAFENRRYNKLLRLFIVLIYYYLYTEKILIYNSQIINNVYIESSAVNPISIYLLLQIGFSIVIDDKIDVKLTNDKKTSSFESLGNFLIENGGIVILRYSIHSMTLEHITKIKQQITDLILGTSPDNNKTLKCLNNKNNRKKTLWNQENSNQFNTGLFFNPSAQ